MAALHAATDRLVASSIKEDVMDLLEVHNQRHHHLVGQEISPSVGCLQTQRSERQDDRLCHRFFAAYQGLETMPTQAGLLVIVSELYERKTVARGWDCRVQSPKCSI